MKTTFLSIALFTAISAQAQKIDQANVPSAVVNAFNKKYPSSKVEKWEKEGAYYEAEFDLNDIESSALFDEKGNFKEIEQEIKISELPKQALEFCISQFVDYKIVEAAEITSVDGTKTYEAEMRNGKKHFDAIFDEKGNFIKKA